MDDSSIPQDIMALAQERSAARAVRDYPAADELKTRIETAGWRVVDAGTTFELRPARPADVVEDARTIYGAVDSVPSRLDEPASRMATLVVVAQGERSPDPVLQACSAHASAETQVLVVAGQETPIEGPAHEIIWTVEPFGAGDALQAALRRAVGTVVVVIDPGRVPTRDVVGPLTEALADPAVAIAASEGLISTDLHRYQPATTGDATTVASGCYAFRREDAIAQGPIDDRLRLGSSVATWLGLILRDRGPDSEPRRAAVIELPFETTGEEPELTADHARLARRDSYRIADRFRDHDWLAAHQPPQGRLVGDGTDGHEHHHDTHESGHTDES